MAKVAIIGAGGVIGREYLRRIITAKVPVIAVEQAPEARAQIIEEFPRICVTQLEELQLDGIDVVIEAIFENLKVKRNLLQQIEGMVSERSRAPVFLSCTSHFSPGELFQDTKILARRSLVAHPLNPPSVIPLVELVPREETSDDVIRDATEFFESLGMRPVLLRKELKGFISNRLQAALLREALILVQDGVCSPGQVDEVVKEGLGLRWASAGPFEVAHENTSGGFREHAQRLGSSYGLFGLERSGRNPWDDASLISRVSLELEGEYPLTYLDDYRSARAEAVKAVIAAKQR